jgi:hypothetical protein
VIANVVSTWTLVGVSLTALFTGILAWIGILSLRHSRDVSGRRKPIVIGRADVTDSVLHPGTSLADSASAYSDPLGHRVVLVHLYNHSDSEQIIYFNHGTIWWPRIRPKPTVAHQSITLPAHRGGSMALVLAGASWPDGSERTERVPRIYETKYWGSIRGRTASLQRVRYRGRLPLADFDPMWLERRLPGV